MRDGGGEYRIGPGAASLILITVVLSMSVMGMLALFSARADLALSQRGAEMTSGLYVAEARIEERLSELDALCKKNAGAGAAYLEAVRAGLPSDCKMERDRISFSEDAGASRRLMVEIQLSDPAKGGSRYTQTRALIDQAPWSDTTFEREVW
ncbi:MAG: hypothetical protein RSE59_05280 [Clostridia bacterium]